MTVPPGDLRYGIIAHSDLSCRRLSKRFFEAHPGTAGGRKDNESAVRLRRKCVDAAYDVTAGAAYRLRGIRSARLALDKGEDSRCRVLSRAKIDRRCRAVLRR